jgi:hypothetical protein
MKEEREGKRGERIEDREKEERERDREKEERERERERNEMNPSKLMPSVTYFLQPGSTF